MAANELVYKGYTGSIEVSIEDGCLHGRVLFIDDLITYEGNTVEEIKTSFQNATDRYITYCEKTGKPANKPYSGTFNVRIGTDRHRALAHLAYKNKKSINEVICQAIDWYQRTPLVSVAFDERVFFYGKRISDRPITPAISNPAISVSVFDIKSEDVVNKDAMFATYPAYGTC